MGKNVRSSTVISRSGKSAGCLPFAVRLLHLLRNILCVFAYLSRLLFWCGGSLSTT